jgi:anti-sigma regulatory factor (Ser/Thr protein kinase)
MTGNAAPVWVGEHHDLATGPMPPGARRRSAAAWREVPRVPGSGADEIAAGWPLRDFLELGALPGAVPCARLHVRQLLWEWNLASLSEAIELITSELLTNAVQVSRKHDLLAPVRLWLLADRQRVMVLVWDASPEAPVRIDACDCDDAEHGRGLLLVESISSRWSWYLAGDAGGKVVWAQVGRDQ